MMNKDYLESIGITIKTRDKFPGLMLLNYSQIETPKNIKEAHSCRGHIVDENGFYKCRPFDRFFNYGEQGVGENVDWTKVTVLEKLDGSLIKVWFDGTNWQIGTRGTFDAESPIHLSDITFRDHTIKTFGLENEQDWQQWAAKTFDKNWTYLFELTSPHNRVVVPHVTNNLWLLAVRNNNSGDYWKFGAVCDFARQIDVLVPKQYHFTTIDECLETVKSLPFNDEGYVVYGNNGPFMKLKSPAYVAIHRMRGEGITPSRICDLVWLFEEEEYLAYFQEDKVLFDPYIIGRDKLIVEIDEVFSQTRNIESQKDFALAVKDKSYSSVLFTMRKQGIEQSIKAIEEQTPQYRERLLRNYLNS